MLRYNHCSLCFKGRIEWGAQKVKTGDVVPLCSRCAARSMNTGRFKNYAEAQAFWSADDIERVNRGDEVPGPLLASEGKAPSRPKRTSRKPRPQVAASTTRRRSRTSTRSRTPKGE